jgi:hypothetical protein
MNLDALWFGITGFVAAVLVIAALIKCVKDDNDD